MAKKKGAKPALGLTDQLIVAREQIINAAEAELEDFRGNCVLQLINAINDASNNLLNRGNATNDSLQLITVIDFQLESGLVEDEESGGELRAYVHFATSQVAAASLSDQEDVFLIPEDKQIAFKAKSNETVFAWVDPVVIVEKLITLETFPEEANGRGMFAELINELVLNADPNNK